MLIVRDLDIYYARAQVLFGLSLDVHRGEAVALLGRNGAGKSTALKGIMGLVKSACGELSFNGHRIDGWPAYRICRLGLGFVPEDRRIFTNLTVAENLEVGRRPMCGERPEWTPERLFKLFPNLAEIQRRRASQISGGEQQMLTIARTLMGNPAMVLLDEPSEGLAPIILQHLVHMIGVLKDEGLTLLLSEQNLRFAALVADRVAVIETGRLCWQGSMGDFVADHDAQRRFLAA